MLTKGQCTCHIRYLWGKGPKSGGQVTGKRGTVVDSSRSTSVTTICQLVPSELAAHSSSWIRQVHVTHIRLWLARSGRGSRTPLSENGVWRRTVSSVLR